MQYWIIFIVAVIAVNVGSQWRDDRKRKREYPPVPGFPDGEPHYRVGNPDGRVYPPA
jgi:hypothetical protein